MEQSYHCQTFHQALETEKPTKENKGVTVIGGVLIGSLLGKGIKDRSIDTKVDIWASFINSRRF